MNAISRSVLALAMLAAISACGQADEDNGMATADNADNADMVVNDALVNEVTPAAEANVPDPAKATGESVVAPSPSAPAATKVAPVPPKPQPKVTPPPADPHAGHDMDNMSDDEMRNMSR